MNYYNNPPPGEMFRPPPYSSHGPYQPPPGLTADYPGQPSLVNVQPQAATQNVNGMDTIGGQNPANKAPDRGEMSYYYGQQYPQMFPAPPPAYAYGPPAGNPPPAVAMVDPAQPTWFMAQQQGVQNVVVINGEGQGHVNHQTFTGAFVYSCFVMWFCNWPFGLVAFILAAMASNRAVSDPAAARKYGRASYGVSNTGLTLTILIIIVAVSASTALRRRSNLVSSSCNYIPISTCYTYKSCFYTRDTCVYSYSGYYSYSTYCCYYN